ncbi:hypothetical protein TNCV_2279751 [Trichonephila clavipes]|uniref:Uncharacterized protein n=1 Tax=Trichonephila clavipes TaxID=2585209 RepID=A0A8X6R9S8_TRICX|nr:hypothetical protein TNCV_2279751 [Trichonephila clavipes]
MGLIDVKSVKAQCPPVDIMWQLGEEGAPNAMYKRGEVENILKSHNHIGKHRQKRNPNDIKRRKYKTGLASSTMKSLLEKCRRNGIVRDDRAGNVFRPITTITEADVAIGLLRMATSCIFL